MSTDITTAIDTLNDYEGDNIWQDVIWSFTGYDDAAALALGAEETSNVIVVDGTVIRYDGGSLEWIVTSK